MRRRQASGDAAAGNNGIFVLDLDPTGKGRRGVGGGRRRGRIPGGAFVLLLATSFAAVAAVCLVVERGRQPAPSSSSGSITTEAHGNENRVGHQDDKEDVTAASKDQPEPESAEAVASYAPLKYTHDPPPSVIPRRLIFTFKSDLLDTEDPSYDDQDPITTNVKETIERYKSFFEGKRQHARIANSTADDVEVTFLTDAFCQKLLSRVERRLITYFYRERKGGYKADMCRAAALYEYGGYYFDVDAKVISPVDFDRLNVSSIIPDPLSQLRAKRGKNWGAVSSFPAKDDVVTFSTVYNHYGRFYMAFTAAAPRHPLMKKSLEYLVAYYEGNLEQVLPQSVLDSHKKDKQPVPSRARPGGAIAGPYTLAMAYEATTDEEWELHIRETIADHDYYDFASRQIPAGRRHSRFLYEISLEDPGLGGLGYFEGVPLQDAEYVRKRRWCNYVVFGGDGTAYFYSRVRGSVRCPLEKKFDDEGVSSHGNASDFADG